MHPHLITTAKIFVAKKKNTNTMFCKDGIFKAEFEVLDNPVYYTVTIKQYDSMTKRFEFVHSYGSPYIQDILHEVNSTN